MSLMKIKQTRIGKSNNSYGFYAFAFGYCFEVKENFL